MLTPTSRQDSPLGSRRRVVVDLLPFWATLLGLALISTGTAALTLSQYEHRAWGIGDGVDGIVTAIEQVPTGMLRLSTASGYQIFDGVEFYTYRRGGEPPPFADRAGTLGQRSPTGAVYVPDFKTQRWTRVWKGRTEEVLGSQGPGMGAQFVFDPDGIGWYVGVGRVFRLDGLKLEAVGISWGLAEGKAVVDVAVDARGTVWIGSEEGEGSLYFLPKGAQKFERFALPVRCFLPAPAPDGSIWCAGRDGLTVVTVADGRPVARRSLAKGSYGPMLFDSAGGFWISSPEGIEHAPDWRRVLEPGGIAALRADAMSPKDGLSSNSVTALKEDADGNIWLGTSAGLHRFRSTRFTPVKLPRRHFPFAMAGDADGSLWAGNWDRSLMHLRDGKIEHLPRIAQVTSIRRDGRDRLWVGTASGLWRKDPGGEFVQIRHDPSAPPIYDSAEDDSGALWILTGHWLQRLKDGRWSKSDAPGTPPDYVSYDIFSDLQGQLWFVSDVRRVFVLRGGAFRELRSQAYADSDINAYTSFVRGPRVWIGSSRGVGAFLGDEFRPLTLNGEVARDITGVVETADGALWFQGLGKVYRLAADQVAAGLGGQVVTPEVLDFRDGLRGMSDRNAPNPTLIEDAKGRLWATTNEGLFWIDPLATPRPAAKPPAVLVHTVRQDGRALAAGNELRLSANPGRVEFSYAAAALGVGNRVRFRYRLVGVDTHWQEAGTRRTADYTQLSPGRYRFEVLASNEQGQWAEVPASLVVDVPPAWYQRLWLRTVGALLVIALLWWMFLLRSRVVAARERGRLREIAAERERERQRIARDLHDTLLQGMQGVILGFHGLASGLPELHASRQLIEDQLDRADQLLGEARDRVRDLRTTGVNAMSLREAFDLAATELAGTMRIDVVEDGAPRPLMPDVRDCAYLIGREAILNAVTHGNGDALRVQLQFGTREFVLCVRDNGVGIDPGVLASGARPGHYGLVGMRERAVQIGAKFSMSCSAGGGTQIELQVPAARAYEVLESACWWQRLRRAWPGAPSPERGTAA